MKNLILFFTVLSSISFGKQAYDVYRMPSSGNAPGWGTIFYQSLPSVNIGYSASVSSFCNTSSTPGQVISGSSSPITVTLTTHGRPVAIFLTQTSSAGGGGLSISVSNSVTSEIVNTTGQIQYKRDSTVISNQFFQTQGWVVGGGSGVSAPVGTALYIDTGASAGSHTYSVWLAVSAPSPSANSTAQICTSSQNLVAYEM